MTLKDLKKAIELAENHSTDDIRVYLRKKNRKTQYETESADFHIAFSPAGQESFIEIIF